MVSNCVAAMLAVSLLGSLPQPLDWQPNYSTALEATRADDQPLLVVIDDPASDGTRLQPELLGEEYDLLQAYRRCHVDVTTEHGKKVARAFRATDLPFAAIIDKTGSVILHSKAGKIASDEWQEMLEAHRDGERSKTGTTSRVSYKISQDPEKSAGGGFSSPNYCPSCQRRSM